MVTENGCGNWRLTWREQNGEAIILRAATCDQDAVLPDTINGLPVTSLGDRCFNQDAPPVAANELVLVFGSVRSDAEWSNRKFRTLTLPKHLKTIENYALINCRAMHTLYMHDGVRSIGPQSLMNCVALRRICLTVENNNAYPIAAIAEYINKELEFSLFREASLYGAPASSTGDTSSIEGTLSSGDTSSIEGTFFSGSTSSIEGTFFSGSTSSIEGTFSSGSTFSVEYARLIYPEYFEEYEENMPVHLLDLKLTGAGIRYRTLFTGGKLDLSEYDSLWPYFLGQEHWDHTAVRLCWSRLRYPGGLTKETEDAYHAYVSTHLSDAFNFVFDHDPDGIETLLEYPEITAADISAALQTARDRHLTQATAALLEKQRKLTAGTRAAAIDKDFDL